MAKIHDIIGVGGPLAPHFPSFSRKLRGHNKHQAFLGVDYGLEV